MMDADLVVGRKRDGGVESGGEIGVVGLGGEVPLCQVTFHVECLGVWGCVLGGLERGYIFEELGRY